MENEEKKKGGRPAYKVTDAGKKQVLKLAGLGLSQEEVATSMGISVETLVKYYKNEYEKGKSDSLVELVNVLREKAIKDKDFKSLNLLVKCKYGWKETEVKEHTGKDGGAIEFSDAKDRLMGDLLK
jgi:DNA-binding CsgD family transcriptional regulator